MESKTITTRQGKTILVDAEDYEMLSQYKWHVVNTGRKYTCYATAAIKQEDGSWKSFYMHRLIMKPGKDLLVDHRNGCGTDNRKSNLRICTKAENNRNSTGSGSSKYLGVRLNTAGNRWLSAITSDYKVYNLGTFKTEAEAALVYNAKAIELHGEFAHLNIIETVEA